MPSLFKRSNGVYYICYEEDGKKRWKSTGKNLKADAYSEMMQFQNHLKTYRSRMILQQFTEELLSHAQVNYAEATREMYRRSLSLFQGLVGNKYVSAVTSKDADNFRTMRAKSVSPVSVNIELRTLKASFSLAIRWKLISENPFKGISFIKVPEQQPTYNASYSFGITPVFESMRAMTHRRQFQQQLRITSRQTTQYFCEHTNLIRANKSIELP